MTVNLPAFTSNPPQINHQKTTFCTAFLPNPQQKRGKPRQKKLLQKRSLFGLGFGFFGGNDDGGGDFVLGFEVEELDALGAATGGADGFGIDADDLAELAGVTDSRLSLIVGGQQEDIAKKCGSPSTQSKAAFVLRCKS
jgi:hypothetical protein